MRLKTNKRFTVILMLIFAICISGCSGEKGESEAEFAEAEISATAEPKMEETEIEPTDEPNMTKSDREMITVLSYGGENGENTEDAKLNIGEGYSIYLPVLMDDYKYEVVENEKVKDEIWSEGEGIYKIIYRITRYKNTNKDDAVVMFKKEDGNYEFTDSGSTENVITGMDNINYFYKFGKIYNAGSDTFILSAEVSFDGERFYALADASMDTFMLE